MKSGVYQIVNTVNQKRYIGCSVNIQQRCRKHREKLTKNTHENAHLQAAWNKYGKVAFTFEVIEYCEDEIILMREDYWAKLTMVTNDEYGYNIRHTDPSGKAKMSEESIKRGVESRRKIGTKMSDEGKIAISEKIKERWRKWRETNKRKPKSVYYKNYYKKVEVDKRKLGHSEETKEKIRQKRAEQIFPEDYNQTLSNSQKERRKKEANSKKLTD